MGVLAKWSSFDLLSFIQYWTVHHHLSVLHHTNILPTVV